MIVWVVEANMVMLKTVSSYFTSNLTHTIHVNIQMLSEISQDNYSELVNSSKFLQSKRGGINEME